MDNKQIDRQELDKYITQEPPDGWFEEECDYDEAEDEVDEAEEYYEHLNSQIVDEEYLCVVQPYTNFQVWIGDVVGILRDIRRLLWLKCPDTSCKMPERVLWFPFGKHKDCIPF